MGARWAILGMMVVALSACGTSSASASSSSKRLPCGPASAHTLSASDVARVYASGRKVFGCSRRRRGTIALGDAQSCLRATQVGPVVVKGELAAYGTLECGVDTGSGGITVRRLDDGKVLHTAAATEGARPPEGYDTVESVVLKLDGSVAWIGRAFSIVSHGNHAIQVHAIDRTGRHLLDSGPSIGTGSLRLRGSTLSWRHGTRTRTATLR